VRFHCLRPLCASALLAALAGCAAGPNYHRPDVPVVPQWKEEAPWRAAAPQDGIPKGGWWTMFGDDELSGYEVQALRSNATIDIARNQLQQARASVRITQSGLFPQLAAGFSAQRASASANQPTASGIPLAGASARNTFSIPFNATWEADVFGGVRRNVENGAHTALPAFAASIAHGRELAAPREPC